MHDTSFNPYGAWSAESFWLIWSHWSRYKVLWFLSPVSWPQDCNIPNPDCSIPYVYILLSDDELTNSLYGQLPLLQRQIVLTKIVIHSVHVEKWNSTRENSTYCIIISTVSKNWGGLSSICLRISSNVFPWGISQWLGNCTPNRHLDTCMIFSTAYKSVVLAWTTAVLLAGILKKKLHQHEIGMILK